MRRMLGLLMKKGRPNNVELYRGIRGIKSIKSLRGHEQDYEDCCVISLCAGTVLFQKTRKKKQQQTHTPRTTTTKTNKNDTNVRIIQCLLVCILSKLNSKAATHKPEGFHRGRLGIFFVLVGDPAVCCVPYHLVTRLASVLKIVYVDVQPGSWLTLPSSLFVLLLRRRTSPLALKLLLSLLLQCP